MNSVLFSFSPDPCFCTLTKTFVKKFWNYLWPFKEGQSSHPSEMRRSNRIVFISSIEVYESNTKANVTKTILNAFYSVRSKIIHWMEMRALKQLEKNLDQESN